MLGKGVTHHKGVHNEPRVWFDSERRGMPIFLRLLSTEPELLKIWFPKAATACFKYYNKMLDEAAKRGEFFLVRLL